MNYGVNPEETAGNIPSTRTDGVVLVGDRLIHTQPPDKPACRWIGNAEPFRLLGAAWLRCGPADPAMSPVLVGPPGCGKTTLACAVAASYEQPIYLMNCSSDMRPEDLLITPVIASNREIRYQASSLVSAAISGGICVLDEANRMSEKTWASLAPLLDDRRYVDSVIAGIKIHAHPEFRLVATANRDSSTFNIPAYIESRLRPVIRVDLPSQEELAAIVQENVPTVSTEVSERILQHLEHLVDTGRLGSYSVRDAIQVCRFVSRSTEDITPREAVRVTLGLSAQHA